MSLQALRGMWVVASCCIDTANQRPSPPQGNPEEHTILEFAQLIKNPVGSGSKIQFLSEAQDDPPEKETRHQESEADAGVGANGPAGGRVKQSHLLLPERTRVPCK